MRRKPYRVATSVRSNESAIELAIGEHDDSNFEGEKRGALDRRTKIIAIVLIAAVVFMFFGLVIPKNMLNEVLHTTGYNQGYTLSWFVDDLSENVSGLFALFVGDTDEGAKTLKLAITYIVIWLCGAGLALCGTLYQGTFRNALVSPSTLGVMAGASLGMAVWVALFFDSTSSHGLWFETGNRQVAIDPLIQVWNSYGLAICSFLGCIIVVGLVLLTMGTIGKNSTSGLMMIIIGQVIGSIMGAVTSSMRYYYITVDPEGSQATMLMELQISSFYRDYSFIDVLMIGIPVLVMFALVMHYRSQLTLLAFSEEEARAMGVETRRMRFIVIGFATLLTAIIVSFCGMVGFVGFMIPHLARRLVGPNFTYLIPLAMVGGGIFVMAAYILITITLGETYATMSGMFISIAGAVVFMITAIRGTGGRRGAF